MKNLRAIRKARQLSQMQLAEAAGVSQATISKVEKGANVSLLVAERIARVLGVDPVELFGINELEQRYLDAMRRASPARRQAVLLLLENEEQSGRT